MSTHTYLINSVICGSEMISTSMSRSSTSGSISVKIGSTVADREVGEQDGEPDGTGVQNISTGWKRYTQGENISSFVIEWPTSPWKPNNHWAGIRPRSSSPVIFSFFRFSLNINNSFLLILFNFFKKTRVISQRHHTRLFNILLKKFDLAQPKQDTAHCCKPSHWSEFALFQHSIISNYIEMIH
jgi:hypothetical protein